MTIAFDTRSTETTLFAALLDAARRHGQNTLIVEDTERKPLTYSRLILGALILGHRLAASTERRENVGVLLPNVAGLALTIFGLNAFGRVAAMLNFTAGPRNLVSALQTGRIRTVVTSRRFIETAKLDDVIAALASTESVPGQSVRIVYLEDVRRAIGRGEKALGVARAWFAAQLHRSYALRPDEPAVVLFTSGTEGTPKGVALSNANLVANSHQMFVHAGGVLSSADTILNPLPMFHSFGLTAATLMPVLNGMKVVLYPSPLHYKQVSKLIGETKATILFATDTFLQGYARAADAGDLASVRFVIAGAERVKDATRAAWNRTGTVILEGYGVTECSPVLACNLPATNKPGTVGRLLPGIEVRLDPVPGIASGGRLAVRGPNVMAGYLIASRPDIVPPAGGWHDTGDIVEIDDTGLVAIKGRAKRFAKIGGEMISLAAVEAVIADLWPDANHVVVALPDARKGEQLVLVTDKPGAGRDDLQARAKAEGLPELWMPRTVLVVPQIPMLGSGKVDVVTTLELARSSRSLP